MFKITSAAALASLLAGCAGLTLKPISQDEAGSHHNGSRSGYIVYAPIVMLAIGPGANGACTITQFTVPDYSKPYVIDSRAGLAKAGVEVTITDGWRLGGFKDNSDNSSLFPVSDLLGFLGAEAEGRKCTESRFYQLGRSGKFEIIDLP